MENQNLPAVVQAAIAGQGITLQNVNLMLPTQTFGEIIGKYDKISFELVKIDATSKDVYQPGKKGEYALGKRPLMSIANALNIIWDPKYTGIVESTPTKARAKATGILKKPNGEYISLTDEKTVDLTAIEREQRLEAKKGKSEWDDAQKKYAYRPWKDNDEMETTIEKALVQVNKYMHEIAMTKAKERVIRQLIAIKDMYTSAELAKPFAFPHVTLDAEKMLQNPALRDAAIDKMTGSARSIFGNSDHTPEDRPQLTNGNTITGCAEDVTEGEEVDLFGSAISTEQEEDPAEAEYKELRSYLVNICPQLSPSNQAGLTAWMQTKAFEDIDELRAMKTKIKGAIAGKKRGAE